MIFKQTILSRIKLNENVRSFFDATLMSFATIAGKKIALNILFRGVSIVFHKMQLVKDYCETSTLHGFSYLAQEKRTRLEKWAL